VFFVDVASQKGVWIVVVRSITCWVFSFHISTQQYQMAIDIYRHIYGHFSFISFCENACAEKKKRFALWCVFGPCSVGGTVLFGGQNKKQDTQINNIHHL
jgi:hypothetical protein